MARIYAGTYAKYNSGSIAGAWLDLDDYSGSEEFFDACKALHADESDPELMFQDWEDIPDGMISESYLSNDVWDWLALSEDDRELLAIYRENVDREGSINDAQDKFMGTADSPANWACAFLEDSGEIKNIPEYLRGYFDYESYARDCGYDGVTFARYNGEYWVFSA